MCVFFLTIFFFLGIIISMSSDLTNVLLYSCQILPIFSILVRKEEEREDEVKEGENVENCSKFCTDLSLIVLSKF